MFDIVLGIIGLAAIVIFTYHVAQTSKATERNPALWAILTAGVGIGFQWIVPLILGIIVGVYIVATGGPPEEIVSQFGWLIATVSILSFIASFVGMFLIMKHVSKIPDEPAATAAQPPPPPTFS